MSCQSHNLNEAYQNAVDHQSTRLLCKEAPELRRMPKMGTFDVLITDTAVQGVWEHFIFADGTHHVLFQLERKSMAVLLTRYMGGVKILPDGKVALLNTQELGYYEL